MMNISIIVKKDDNISKYIVMIRKITCISILDIKKSIQNGNPIIKCALFKNDDSKETVEKFITELINLGANLIIMKEENNQIEKVSAQYLLNRINGFKEISKQNQQLDDIMYGED